ncbi:type III secretion protein [Pectobacterium punjabense]|uniref:type III secretion protein n=1 Tax=Pectobacterium punjabense TaxID=2108399 RepID=UPI0031204C6D
MNKPAEVFDNQHDFLMALDTVPTVCWRIQPGVTLWSTTVSARQEAIVLTLAPARHYPGMLRQILQRRFLEADALSACGLSLDDQQNLRLHHILSPSAEPARAVEALWRLAGLPPR